MKKKYITVDLTSVYTPWQLIGSFVDAKVDNNIAIEPYELQTYAHWNYEAGIRDGKLNFAVFNFSKPEKPNIFKRAWNWIKSKFKK